MFCTSKAHIPPEIVSALGTQCKQKQDKQHEIDMLYTHIANVKYIPPACIGPCVGSAMLCVGSEMLCAGSEMLCVGSKVLRVWFALLSVGSARLFIYLHVGIPNAKWSRLGHPQCESPTQTSLSSGGIQA